MALVESSRYLRDAALSRSVGARAPGAGDAAATGAWVQAIGGSGKLDGDANTARTQSNTSGLLVGLLTDGTPRGMAALLLCGSIGAVIANHYRPRS